MGVGTKLTTYLRMRLQTTLLGLLGFASAMPRFVNESSICEGGACVKKDMKYELVSPAQPGYQWNDAGGYCGSWAVQRATLTRGAYISQQQVRDHTSSGGGTAHDNEIISTNIEEAFKNLKISAEGFDYVNEPLPQQDAYFKWLKKQLVAGFPVTWMIMWDKQPYPIYKLTPPAGMYGHVEPVIGIQSNHPLNDTTVYDDDVAMHFTDGGVNTVHKTISTLKGDWAGVDQKADCHGNKYCIGPYSFGWAVKGFVDDKQAMRASLQITPSKSEPDSRSGEKAVPIKGTLTVTDLTVGSSYDIYRWDTVDEAFTYRDNFKKISFQATSSTFVYEDSNSFLSNSTTYYRCVPL